MNPDLKSVRLYFILTFIISWGLWSPLYFSDDVGALLVLPGAWGPTFAAIILVLRKEGRSGLKQFLRKLLIWKVSIKYYLFAILGLLALGLIAVAIHVLLGGNPIDAALILKGMGLEEDAAMMAIVLFPLFFLINTLLGGPVAEELGWRGYAQPALQKKYSPVVTGIIIGLFWSLWHLPLMIFMPQAVGNLPAIAYIPLMTSMGVVFAWLYNHTRGSVLLAILLHGGMNFTIGVLGGSLLTDRNLLSIYVVLIILLALFLGWSLHKIQAKQADS